MSGGKRLHPWIYFWTSTAVILAALCYWMVSRSQRAKALWLNSHKSVQVRTSGFSSISCLGRKGAKISCSFLGFCHFPRILLGSRVRSLFAWEDISLCPLPRLGKSPSSLPCFSQAPSSSTSSMWLDGFGLSPTPMSSFCFRFPPWHCLWSENLKA